MKAGIHTFSSLYPKRTLPQAAESEPTVRAIVLIFWSAFAAALVVTRIFHPTFFEAQDPDSFLRIVQVRDLIAGQGWWDLVQHRMDPPSGALMQWSRVIDLPLALLVMIGNATGIGESFALTLWPLFLLLGLMSAAAAIGEALGGRSVAVLSLILVLFFIDPLILYFPGDIDHHNAQIALMMATVAFVLRLKDGMRFGVMAGAASALTLAIGLEMLPYVAVIGVTIAFRFAWTGKSARAVAGYGATLGLLSGVLYLLTGSQAAPMACDALSWAYVGPTLIAGAGLAGLAWFYPRLEQRARIATIFAIGAASFAWFIGVTPACLSGPYGQLSPEVKTAFLDTVTEAQPIWVYAAREPVGAIGSLGPLVIALVIAGRRLRQNGDLWLVPTVLLALAVALSCYQVRTLPFASGLAIPVLAVWLVEVRARTAGRYTLLNRLRPIAVAFAVAIPFTWLLVGWVGEKAVAAVSGGAIAPAERPQPDEALVAGLTTAEKNCFDPASAALLDSVPRGLVIAPLFYGSTVLKLSDHSVVAGPYHRNGQAILDSINAMYRTPEGARPIISARGVDYVAVCETSPEAARAEEKAPDGLLAQLASGRVPAWLTPIPAKEGTGLRLWRVGR